jgi:hypothetical protein
VLRYAGPLDLRKGSVRLRCNSIQLPRRQPLPFKEGTRGGSSANKPR